MTALLSATRRRLNLRHIVCRSLSTRSGYDGPLNTVVLLGSTREKRVGGRVGDYLVSQLEERGGHNVTVLDPRTTGDGFFLSLMEKAHFHYKEGEEVPAETMVVVLEVLQDANCFDT